MNNTFILLVSPNLVVTPKITFQLDVVYGQETKMYFEKIGFSSSQRGDLSMGPQPRKFQPKDISLSESSQRGDTRWTQLGKMQYPRWSTTYVKRV